MNNLWNNPTFLAVLAGILLFISLAALFYGIWIVRRDEQRMRFTERLNSYVEQPPVQPEIPSPYGEATAAQIEEWRIGRWD